MLQGVIVFQQIFTLLKPNSPDVEWLWHVVELSFVSSSFPLLLHFGDFLDQSPQNDLSDEFSAPKFEEFGHFRPFFEKSTLDLATPVLVQGK